MIRIVKYTERLQKLVGLKTKPEPWLHCIFDVRMNPGSGKSRGTFKYAIYIWDTRQVVEFNDKGIEIHTAQLLGLLSPTVCVNAYDNHQDLKGTAAFNDYMKQHAKQDVKIDADEALSMLEQIDIDSLQPADEELYNDCMRNYAATEAEGFRLKIKGQPGQYYTGKVFATKEEAKAYAEQNHCTSHVSIVKHRDTPTKAEQQQKERQKRAQERSAKRDAKNSPKPKKVTAEDWARGSSARKMFNDIKLRLSITPDDEFPTKTMFLDWINKNWDELTDIS